MAEMVFFFIFAIIAVVSAVGVVTLRNPVHSVLSLMVCFLQMAALFVLLRSPFLAVVQVFVYVGAVMVLFLFVIMMLDIRQASMKRFVSGGHSWIIALLIILIAEMILILSRGRFADMAVSTTSRLDGSVKEMGMALFTKYLLPFEIISMVLLVALLGAIVLGKKELR
ncbi:MAG TPA: NADH-quinone oxidoreductase subunit J [Nitrospirota bacterium]|nr:NADH-quinone oxidoreductase subunit J [Nitrospirota bacterium]